MAGPVRGAPGIGSGVDPVTQRLLENLKETSDVGAGVRGRSADAYVRRRDLLKLGFHLRGGRLVGDLELDDLDPDSEPPPGLRPGTPTGLEAIGLFDAIMLRWDRPSVVQGAGGQYHANTIIYRSTVNDFTEAVQVASVYRDMFYADYDVQLGTKYYYWIRFEWVNGDTGPLSNGGVGVEGEIAEKAEDILARLEGKITSLELASELNTYIDGLANQHTIKIGQNGVAAGFGLAFTPPTYNPSNPNHSIAIFNVDTFAITHPGETSEDQRLVFVVEDGHVAMDGASIVDASITNAKIQNVAVEKIQGLTAEFMKAELGEAWITSAMIDNFIESTNYVPGSAGWRINLNGNAEFRNITARGNIQATSLEAGTAMVDTLHVNGNAITVPAAAIAQNVSVSSFFTTMVSVTDDFVHPNDGTGPVIINFGISWDDGTLEVRIEAVKSGSVVAFGEFTVGGDLVFSFPVTFFLTSGAHTIRVRARRPSGSTTMDFVTLQCIGAKR